MATIKDIAKIAHVSVSTVSLALNDSPLVKAETRYRIVQIAKDLNYRPNKAARSLATRETKTIALFRTSGEEYPVDDTDVFSHNMDSLLLTMLPYIQNRVWKAGYSILVDIFNKIPASPSELLPENSLFGRTIIDGAVFFGGMISDSQVETIRTSGIPSVLVCSRDENIDYVDTDSQEGIRLAVAHLLAAGHRKIAFINGSSRSQVSARKLSGYRQALQEHGLAYDERLVEYTDFSGASTLQAMERLEGKNLHPTAIVAGTDYIACAVLVYLRKKNLFCPEDISVVGYENAPISAYCSPGITTVNIHKPQLGDEAARILLSRIKNPNAHHVSLIIPPTLVERNSVASL